MNEIQAVKTAKIEEVKKNSKKGFTLVELVVVIAILAILAAIAIPVVASTIKSSQVSSAKSNAQTIELAIKEAQAAISSGDDSVFNAASTGSSNTASGGNLTVADVAKAKKIESALDAEYNISGKTYVCAWDSDTAKIYFVDKTSATTTIDGKTLTGTVTQLKSTSTTDVTTLAENAAVASVPAST